MSIAKNLSFFAASITYLLSCGFISLIQTILFIALKPFNAQLYRKINYYLCYGMCAQFVLLAERWGEIKVVLYLDKSDYKKYFGKEHAFCIGNHTYEVDWIVIPTIMEPLGILGNFKSYVKKVLRFVPGMGWVLSYSEGVFLERSFEKDKECIEKQVANLAKYEDPMWLVLYPEGTRFTLAKHEASTQFSIKNNLPLLKYHLQPRTKGFITSLPPMRGKIPAIYDMLIAFKTDGPENNPPTLKTLLQGKSLTCHVYIDRIPMETVPDNETGQDEFLRNLFVKKDKMRDSFEKTGDFFKTSGIEPLEPFLKEKRYTPLIFWTFLIVVIFGPVLYVIMLGLFSGKLLYSSLTIGFLLCAHLLMNKAAGMADMKKSSSYGLQEKKET